MTGSVCSFDGGTLGHGVQDLNALVALFRIESLTVWRYGSLSSSFVSVSLRILACLRVLCCLPRYPGVFRLCVFNCCFVLYELYLLSAPSGFPDTGVIGLQLIFLNKDGNPTSIGNKLNMYISTGEAFIANRSSDA